MGVSWTEEQQKVIDLRKRNILVSAAAGSGKTAVLVERIVKRITEGAHPTDIDRLLVVTFTNAAAAEMRERIGAAIEKALAEYPENEHLQRQLTLIHNAQITTIDSFCLHVIRNHFHEIDLEPNFRIGDEGELKLLREDVLKKVMDRNYGEVTPEFTALLEGYSSGRSDAALRGMILSLYEFSRSYPWPKEWLLTCREEYRIRDERELAGARWMGPLIETIRCVFRDAERLTEQAYLLTKDSDGPDMYAQALLNDRERYSELAACETFGALYAKLQSLTYDRLPSSRGFEGDAKKLERVKKLREEAKDAVKKINRQYFFCAPSVMAEQLRGMEQTAEELVRLATEFADAFAAEKRRKNLVDFHDLEHFALEILVDRQTKETRKTAEEFRDTFEEIMIDEYQDSNHVQETILRAISQEARGENNMFMVGDVKQSIYRFRLARPELFMEKYDTYTVGESAAQRIDLHKNFRSREEVLSFTNDIFYRIMAKDLGNVEYGSEAALYPGAVYKDGGGDSLFEPEILIADSSDALLEDADGGDKKLLEAKLVAGRIKRLREEQSVTDRETGGLRRVRYSDIVILLRSLNGWADAFMSVLNDAGIPAHTVSAAGYFSAVEVQTVLSMLRILDNPRQDIPLAAVLRSPIAGMTDEELARLRLKNERIPFCECVLERCAQLSAMPEPPAEEKKLYDFYIMYLKLRKLVPDTPIHELIEILLKETGYGNYAAAMPAGRRREANLCMLVEKAIAYEKTSYKGLFHFVRYIDKLQKYDVDFGEADTVSENEDVVRIMSIHKSKGLEFPVVIVSGLGKNFNRQDVRSRMVLHPELGMGLDLMDGKRRLKSPTIIKRAIAKQIDLENLGEELRVLYVALTRAKEKLILTGTKKDAAAEVERLKDAAEQLAQPNGRLSYLSREGAAGYLDWILPAVLSYGDRYNVRVVGAAELVMEEIETRTAQAAKKEPWQERIKNADPKLVAMLEERFTFRYPYHSDMERKNKYSVSELKHRAMREQSEREEEALSTAFLKEESIPYIPAFARKTEETSENRGALRGTAMHRFMECFRFASELDASKQLEQMVLEKRISKESRALIKLPLVERFLFSETGQRMRQAEAAKKLHREKPFVMGFTEAELARFGFGEIQAETVSDGAKAVAEGEAEDLTLIQGIIDVFWEEEDGIVLLDYKTDRVETGKQLADRYAAQLKLYAEALERIYNGPGERNVKVKERLLYSFRLGEIIEV